MADTYGNWPPPGQGYRHPDPRIGGYDYDNAPPPHRTSYSQQDAYGAPAEGGVYDHAYSPPPSRTDFGTYREDGSVIDRGFSRARRYSNARPYAPVEPRPHDENAVAPYDEEKAYAQYSDAYGVPDYGQGGPPPRETSDRGYEDRRSWDDGGSLRYEDRERMRNSRPAPEVNDRRRGYSSDRYSRPPRPPADDEYRPRKRNSPPKREGKDILRGGDGDRGLGATVLGGAAGALLGNNTDKGMLGTLSGAILGAVAGEAFGRHQTKRDQDREARRRYGRDHTNSSNGTLSRGRLESVSPPPAPVDEFRPRRRGKRSRTRDGSDTDSGSSED